MRNKLYLYNCFLLLFFLFSAEIACCQSTTPDTLFVSKAALHAREIYTAGIGTGAHLFNGIQFKELNLHSYDRGYPYFLSDDWVDGSIFYDGQSYHDVAILYDVTRDKIIIDHAFSHFSIELINEKVKSFSISSHTFIRLVKDTLRDSPIRTGYYDLLYNGNVKVYAKRRKEIREIIESRTLIRSFDEIDQFMIYKNGHYHSVKGRVSVLKVFSDRKASVRKFLNKSKMNFRANREQALAESARFYDESDTPL